MSGYDLMNMNLIKQRRRASPSKLGKSSGRQAQVSLFGHERCETVSKRPDALGTRSEGQMEREDTRNVTESESDSCDYRVADSGNSNTHRRTSASFNIDTDSNIRSVTNKGFDIASDHTNYHYNSTYTSSPTNPTEMSNGMMYEAVPDRIHHYQHYNPQLSNLGPDSAIINDMTKSESKMSFDPSQTAQLGNDHVHSTKLFNDSLDYDGTNDIGEYTQAPGSQYSKPDTTYATIITEAFNAHQNKLLTLNEIYTTIIERYPYFKTAPPGWKNSIRHNLSLHKAFARVARPSHIPGKGSFWKLATGGPDEVPKKQSGHPRRSTSDASGVPIARHSSVSSSRPSLREQQYTFNFSPPVQNGARQLTSGSMMNNLPIASYTNLQHNFSQGHPVYVFSSEDPHSNITRRRAFSMNPYPSSNIEQDPVTFQHVYDFPTDDGSQVAYVQSVVPQMIMNAPLPFYSHSPVQYDPFSCGFPYQSPHTSDTPQSTEGYSQTPHASYTMMRDSASPTHWDPLRAIHQTHLNHQVNEATRRSSITQTTEHENPRVTLSEWPDTASARRASGSESPHIASPSTPRKSSLSTVSTFENQPHVTDHIPGSLVTPDTSPLPPHLRGESQHLYPHYQANTLITPSHSPMTNTHTVSQLQVPLFQQDPTVPAMEVVPSTDDLEVMVSNSKYYNQSPFHMDRPRGMSVTGMIPSSPLKNTVPIVLDKNDHANDNPTHTQNKSVRNAPFKTSASDSSDVQIFDVATPISAEIGEEQADWAFM